MLAIVLLNLLSLTEVSAQNYSSETGKTCTGTGIFCEAMNSEADIYTRVYDDPEYEFNDYSEYGDFSQEIVTSDGEHYYYNYGDTGSTTENSNVYYYSSDTSTLYSGTSYNSDGGYSGGYSGGYGVTSGYGDDDVTWQTGLDEIVVTGTSTSKDYYCILCKERMTAEEWATHNCPNAVAHNESAENGNVQGGGGGGSKTNNDGSKDKEKNAANNQDYKLNETDILSVDIKKLNAIKGFKQGTGSTCVCAGLEFVAKVLDNTQITEGTTLVALIKEFGFNVIYGDFSTNNCDFDSDKLTKTLSDHAVSCGLHATSNVLDFKSAVNEGCLIMTDYLVSSYLDEKTGKLHKNYHDVVIVGYNDEGLIIYDTDISAGNYKVYPADKLGELYSVGIKK